jgi:hypothetical protein
MVFVSLIVNVPDASEVPAPNTRATKLTRIAPRPERLRDGEEAPDSSNFKISIVLPFLFS